MKTRRIKKSAILIMYLMFVVCFGVGIFFINKALTNKPDKTIYVNEHGINNDTPVVKEEKVIIKPFLNNNLEVISNFYDYKTDEESQKKAIIFYNDTYLQNSGIIYGGNEPFDVVAVYDGEVIKVEENETLGKIVEIRHSNDIITTYQLLSETNVTPDQQVKQGQIIGKSGKSNIINTDKQMLYFEMLIRGEYVDADSYFGKKINEL